MEPLLCKACKQTGYGKFCSNCGETLTVKRISLSSLFHEVFHFFTHLDKGFGYTLKQLFKRPGHMQRDYLEGNRKRHQKPFSFFFIIATATGLSLYWINLFLERFYDAGNAGESAFFHQYMIFLLIFSVPYFALITWLFYYRSGYNYAEIGVLVLYTVSVLFLMVIFSNLTKLIWHSFQTRYLELPLITAYAIVTNINFFRSEKKWVVILKTILTTAIFFGTVAFIQDWFVERYLHE